MELKATEAFTWWGTFVSKNKLIVMIVSIVIAAVLAVGMVNMIITTDPVELWAAPTSRSRIEKDFFDSNFRPFYRTEMVIVKAKNLDTVCDRGVIFIYESTLFKPKLMNPVFVIYQCGLFHSFSDTI